MQLVGRGFRAGSGYRYGFNGKERASEITSDDYDYGERIYNPRIAVWLSVDKLQAKHAGETPYLFVGGNPMYFVDPDGKDRIEHIRTIGKDGTVMIKTVTTKGLFKSVWNNTYSGLGYATKNDYEVFKTVDYRGEKVKNTETEYILYGTNHATEISFGKYLRIKLTGSDGNILPQLPQIIVYGSNSEDPGWGTKADPSRPIMSIDLAAYKELMSLIMLGMQVPDLKGADPKKIPELVNNAKEEAERRREEKVKPEVTTSVCPDCYSGEAHDGKNKRVYRNKSDGTPIDTLVPNIKTGIPDTLKNNKSGVVPKVKPKNS